MSLQPLLEQCQCIFLQQQGQGVKKHSGTSCGFLIEKFVFLFLALLLSFFIFTVCAFVGLICFSSKPSKKGIRCDGSVAVNPSAGNPQNNKCMC